MSDFDPENYHQLTAINLDAQTLAVLAWSVIDTVSRDPNYSQQLTGSQWVQLAGFLESVAMIFAEAEEEEETPCQPFSNHRSTRDTQTV